MAKSVDARDLKSLGKSRAGSNPAERTIEWVAVGTVHLEDRDIECIVYWPRSLAGLKPSAHNRLIAGSSPAGATNTKGIQ